MARIPTRALLRWTRPSAGTWWRTTRRRSLACATRTARRSWRGSRWAAPTASSRRPWASPRRTRPASPWREPSCVSQRRSVMRPDETFLLPLATAVSDGEAVDWIEAEKGALAEDELELVHHLRAIAQMAELYRSQAPAVTGPPPGIEAATTVAGPPRHPRPGPPTLTRWGDLQVLAEIGSGGYGRV